MNDLDVIKKIVKNYLDRNYVVSDKFIKDVIIPDVKYFPIELADDLEKIFSLDSDTISYILFEWLYMNNFKNILLFWHPKPHHNFAPNNIDEAFDLGDTYGDDELVSVDNNLIINEFTDNRIFGIDVNRFRF